MSLADLATDDGSHTTTAEEAYSHVLRVLLNITDPDKHAITLAISQMGVDFDFNQIFLHTEEQLAAFKYKDTTVTRSQASSLLTGHVSKLVMLRKFFFFIYRVHAKYPTPYQWTMIDKVTYDQ
jgi:hypothetical protein